MSSTTTVMVLTDGRKACLERTLESLEAHLVGEISNRLIIDDSMDPRYRDWLYDTYHDNGPYRVYSFDRKRGFAGAIQSGWDHCYAIGNDYIWHQEDDFVLLDDIVLPEMVAVLDATPRLAQLALLRQAWAPAEIEAGGVIQLHPHSYRQTAHYTLHRNFFTTNPSLYRISLINLGWPQQELSERRFTEMCLEQGLHFGFWQTGLDDAPKVNHIGVDRVGIGY